MGNRSGKVVSTLSSANTCMDLGEAAGACGAVAADMHRCVLCNPPACQAADAQVMQARQPRP